MADFSPKHMKLGATIGGIVAVVGLVLYVVFRGDYIQQEFWSIYKVATSGAGLMMLIFGALWMVLSLVLLSTRIFDDNARIDADKLVITIVAVGIAVVIALVCTLPRLPSTPTNKLPSNKKQRDRIVRTERGFRTAVSFVVIACGLVVISGPCMRFMKK
jgi:UDP-N-acetylmuramyl pentapeptide phosphotransferase/UDP-N-acetylglucosamine-1-phosphate transferase